MAALAWRALPPDPWSNPIPSGGVEGGSLQDYRLNGYLQSMHYLI